MDNNILKALYYIRKRQIVQSKSLYSVGYIFAIENDCYPLFNSTEEDDFYESFYSISKDEIESVLNTVDVFYSKKQYKSFYDWEEHFKNIPRENLIYIFRYCKLEEKFNDDFWNTLIDHKNNPDEANWIKE